MIVVWQGQSPQISLEIGNSFRCFKQNVPTWVSEAVYKSIGKIDGFELFDTAKTYTPTTTHIFVAMPNTLSLFIGALLTLKKIKESHPLSQIHVQCPPIYIDLLKIGGCQAVNTRQSVEYYREFILTAEAHPILNDINALITTPVQQLILHVAGLMEVGVDRPDIGFTLDVPKGKQNIIISAEIGGFGQLKGVSKLLYDNNPNIFSAEYELPEMDNFSLIYESIKNSETVTCIGDSPYTFLAAALGRRVLIFRLPNPAKDYARQYLCYPNVEVMSGSGASNLEDLTKRIISKIQNTPQPEIRSWERVGLDNEGNEVVKPKPQINARQNPHRRNK